MKDWTGEHLSQLVGMTVKAIGFDPVTPESEYRYEDEYCLTLEGEDGKVTQAWIMCDPEGNGPGHLDIQPLSKAQAQQVRQHWRKNDTGS